MSRAALGSNTHVTYPAWVMRIELFTHTFLATHVEKDEYIVSRDHIFGQVLRREENCEDHDV